MRTRLAWHLSHNTQSIRVKARDIPTLNHLPRIRSPHLLELIPHQMQCLLVEVKRFSPKNADPKFLPRRYARRTACYPRRICVNMRAGLSHTRACCCRLRNSMSLGYHEHSKSAYAITMTVSNICKQLDTWVAICPMQSTFPLPGYICRHAVLMTVLIAAVQIS